MFHVKQKNNVYDVIVIGGGHAGCEAAVAAAKLGANTLLLTINMQKIALMPCNPSIGGIGKGHLVREIDALGGAMARVADKAAIQIKTLNSSKGSAVRALRAQADKKIYEEEMKKTLFSQPGLHIKEALIEHIVATDNQVRGVKTSTGQMYTGNTLVVCAGTFLRGRLVLGATEMAGGRMGEWPSVKLSTAIKRCGVKLERFQSATPPRVDGRTIKYSKTEPQPGDDGNLTFKIDGKTTIEDQKLSYLTYTNKSTQSVILKNLKHSPIKSGRLQSHGPRYCPSIDRKIINFPDKVSHPVFIEPEGRFTQEMYLQGLTTAMPATLQEEIIRTVPGLEDAHIMRPGYAVEYDYAPPQQLKLNLETKSTNGLFLAGQIIGTTGYEEAAALGLMAGVNAALNAKGEEPLILDRSQAYIGVLIDDLVTKGVDEPYRMFTSRAEYRLLLRCDNADFRLSPIAGEIGLVSKEELEKTKDKQRNIDKILESLKKIKIRNEKVNQKKHGGKIRPGMTAYELLKRPDTSISMIDEKRINGAKASDLEIVETMIKYEGYINRQQEEIDRFKRLEHLHVPGDLDYKKIKALSFEAREKLSQVRPTSLGQASRVPGITPADISILHINLRS